jgi:nicotinamide riboside kinase
MSALIVNIVGGPGIGKSTLAAALFATLKKRGILVEHVQEYAKELVWKRDFKTLANQDFVLAGQIQKLDFLVDQVKVIVLDGSLINGMYYNRRNGGSYQRIDANIIEYYNRFRNIVVCPIRKPFEFSQEGRLEGLDESKQIDIALRGILRELGEEYTEIDVDNIEFLADLVCQKI